MSDQVHALRGRISEEEANELSVRLELQAGYLAGVWAHHGNQERWILEVGDIEEAINAAVSSGLIDCKSGPKGMPHRTPSRTRLRLSG